MDGDSIVATSSSASIIANSTIIDSYRNGSASQTTNTTTTNTISNTGSTETVASSKLRNRKKNTNNNNTLGDSNNHSDYLDVDVVDARMSDVNRSIAGVPSATAPPPDQGGLRPNRGQKKQYSNQQQSQLQHQPRGNENNSEKNNSNQVKNHRKRNRNKKRGTTANISNKNNDSDDNNNDNNNRNSSNLYWWRKYIPVDAVDPITLDPLISLKYPPFALVASEPYEPVEEWPVIDAALDDTNKKPAATTKMMNTNTTKTKTTNTLETEEERQRRILEEQWGSTILTKGNVVNQDNTTQQQRPNHSEQTLNVIPISQRYMNLFDGQALAYYMVSQLQFIDPLNRRDITRDELVTLDRYLRKHGFGNNLNVIEAYDAKGITLSTAGATANTAAGRAAILQQEARNLLNALFRAGPSLSTPTTKASTTTTTSHASRNNRNNNATTSRNISTTNALMRQYQAHEQQQQHGASVVAELQQRSQYRQSGATSQNGTYYGNNPDDFEIEEDVGVYGGGGLIVIDDDVNPGLRGDAPTFVPLSTGDSLSRQNGSTLYTARHIASRYGGGGGGGTSSQSMEFDFPTLSATLPSSASTSSTSTGIARQDSDPKKKTAVKKPLPVTKTLLKIGNAVKKTDPEEQQRQWEARELARKKAMLSNLTFGSNPASWDYQSQQQMQQMQNDPPLSATPVGGGGVTEAQIERNKAFANALGIKPATVRSALTSGWSRPTDPYSVLDEFGNELNITLYPDELILKAREYMSILMKLEGKWISFLQDDKSASLPLNKMEKVIRALVHEYATYWKLHTESFDPEPRRYVHCVKLRDTRAPRPLLSDAARSWKGPRPIIASASTSIITEHSSIQSTGQSTHGREERQPLALKPRRVVHDLPSQFDRLSTGTNTSSLSIGGAPSRTMTEVLSDPSETRFGILAAGRERTKLEMKPRTLPHPTPSINTDDGTSTTTTTDELLARHRDRETKRAILEREKAEQKRKVLESAFSSDDEKSVVTDRVKKSNNNNNNINNTNDHDDDNDSDWGEQEALYNGSDDDEHA